MNNVSGLFNERGHDAVGIGAEELEKRAEEENTSSGRYEGPIFEAKLDGDDVAFSTSSLRYYNERFPNKRFENLGIALASKSREEIIEIVRERGANVVAIRQGLPISGFIENPYVFLRIEGDTLGLLMIYSTKRFETLTEEYRRVRARGV